MAQNRWAKRNGKVSHSGKYASVRAARCCSKERWSNMEINRSMGLSYLKEIRYVV